MGFVDSVKDASILHVIQRAVRPHCRDASLAMAVDVMFALQEMPLDERLRLAAKLTINHRTQAQDEAEQAFLKAGHKPEDKSCDHKHWTFEKHGRACTCGTFMVDFGD